MKDIKENVAKAKDKAGSVMKRRTFGEKAKTKDIDGCEEESEGQRSEMLKEKISCKVPVWLALLGWEFAHWVSEQIARFLRKNEQMSDSLKKTSNLLICSFLVRDLSDWLTIAHFL